MNRSAAVPLVSVIVPNYNHAPFLPERFASIRNQTFQDYELIVLDDASSDESLSVIRTELAGFPHQLIINERNSGSPCSQWLKGIQKARGTYIWIAESDDSCSPIFLASMVELIQKGASLCYCRSRPIDADGETINDITYWPDQNNPRQWKSSFTMQSIDFCQRYLVNANVIPNASAVVFLRKTSLNCLSIATTLRSYLFVGDWIFWMHYLISANNAISYIATEASWFRHHADTTRTNTATREKQIQHVDEYNRSVTYLTKQTLLEHQLRWRKRVFAKGWDWILADYMHRLKPTLHQVLTADGLSGPLANLLFIRLLLSKDLRIACFPKLHRRKKRYIEQWNTSQAKLAQALKRLFA
jgi:glycosyltransferase involved in cell wall biosynthesis